LEPSCRIRQRALRGGPLRTTRRGHTARCSRGSWEIALSSTGARRSVLAEALGTPDAVLDARARRWIALGAPSVRSPAAPRALIVRSQGHASGSTLPVGRTPRRLPGVRAIDA